MAEAFGPTYIAGAAVANAAHNKTAARTEHTLSMLMKSSLIGTSPDARFLTKTIV